MLLYKSDFLKLHEITPHVIHAEWCGYFSVELVQQGCEELYKFVVSQSCQYLLNDNRLVKGSFTQAMDYLKDDFMPRLVEAGIKKIAYIYSPDEGAKYSVNRLLEVNTDYFGQPFNNYNEALNWLIGNADVDFQNSYLKIKDESNIEVNIPIQDIYFISRASGLTTIQTKENRFVCKATLKALLENLPKNQFYQIHKSNVVNIKMIKKLKYHAGGYYHAYLKDFGNIYLTVGRVYAQQLKEALSYNFNPPS